VVTTTYVDTSAAMKLVVDEPETESLFIELESGDERRLVSSWLLYTEMHCAVNRHRRAAKITVLKTFLDSVVLNDLTRGDFLAAATHTLRAGDAIHLAVALRLGCDEILTYDAEQAAAAEALGLRVLAPV
jgi:uncharacterized protein